MKLEINIDRELMQQLGPYGFLIVTYCKAIFDKTGKVPSFNQTSKDLGISYLKVRDSLARSFNILFLNNNKYNKYYSFINSKSEQAYNTINRINDKKKEEGSKMKGIEEQRVWKHIIASVQPHFQEKIPSSFYWRTNMWVTKLIKAIGKDEEKIEKYTQWFVYNKKDSIGKFNAGIFCCDSMLEEYLKNPDRNNAITRKRIKIKKEKFKEKADKQNKKILDKILIKIADGIELDKYDEENLRNLKEEGFYVGEI